MKKDKQAKKGDITFQHNLYDVLGHTLLEGVRQGRVDPRKVENMLTANLGIDLGSIVFNLGYNQPSPRGEADIIKAGVSIPIK